jgi:hypothetical protein
MNSPDSVFETQFETIILANTGVLIEWLSYRAQLRFGRTAVLPGDS